MADYQQKIATVLGMMLPTEKPHQLNVAIQNGLPRVALQALARAVYPNRTEASNLVRAIAPSTGTRRLQRALTPDEDMIVIRLARIVVHAREVFADPAEAAEWLRRPHLELGRKPPIVAAMQNCGAHRVEYVLTAIKYGLPV